VEGAGHRLKPKGVIIHVHRGKGNGDGAVSVTIG